MEYEVDDLEFINALQHDMEYETIDIPTPIKPPNGKRKNKYLHSCIYFSKVYLKLFQYGQIVKPNS